jgi:hypothetical protein
MFNSSSTSSYFTFSNSSNLSASSFNSGALYVNQINANTINSTQLNTVGITTNNITSKYNVYCNKIQFLNNNGQFYNYKQSFNCNGTQVAVTMNTSGIFKFVCIYSPDANTHAIQSIGLFCSFECNCDGTTTRIRNQYNEAGSWTIIGYDNQYKITLQCAYDSSYNNFNLYYFRMF